MNIDGECVGHLFRKGTSKEKHIPATGNKKHGAEAPIVQMIRDSSGGTRRPDPPRGGPLLLAVTKHVIHDSYDYTFVDIHALSICALFYDVYDFYDIHDVRFSTN